MPNTRRRRKAAPQPQAATNPQEQTPAPAAPTPPAATEQSMFDETPPAPPAAEQPIVDPAATSEPTVTDGGAQEATPQAAPEPAAPAAPAEDEPATDQALDPIAQLAIEQMEDGQAEKPEGEQQGGGDTSVGPQEVRLGQVIGLLHRMPLGDVLACADTFAEKIEALKYTASVQDLQSRMRVSEGRCAPVYFTGDDDGEPEHLLAGDDALAAAKAVGLSEVFVITIHPRDAGAVQGYLAQKASATNASTEDDELVWRANGYHTD